MHRILSFVFLVACICFASAAWAQDNAAAATATCNFDEENQLVVQYQHVPFNLKKPLSTQMSFGKVYAPGGKPMTLFTNTPIQFGEKDLPIGAYTMWVIPTSKQWTLIVSKSTDVSGTYNEQHDLVRVPMESGQLPTPDPEFSVFFAHVAPDQCSIRIDVEKMGHFALFQKK